MARPTVQRRRSTTCTITRNPTAGETGVTVIVSDLACSPPYPATPKDWELATGFNGWEIVTDDADGIKDKHVVTMASGKVFTIERNKRWPGNERRDGFIHLLLMERGA